MAFTETTSEKQGVTTMNTPEKKFKAGAITATVWNNQAMKDNQPVSYSTISVERSYKDKQGNWKSTNSLRVADLPKTTLVLQKAYEYLTLRQEAEA